MANTVDDAIHDLANEEERARRKGYDHATVGIDELAALLEWAVEARGEEEYEYAIQTTNGLTVHPIFDRDWTTQADAQERMDLYTDSWNRMGRDYLSAKLVKRRKAGGIEQA